MPLSHLHCVKRRIPNSEMMTVLPTHHLTVWVYVEGQHSEFCYLSSLLIQPTWITICPSSCFPIWIWCLCPVHLSGTGPALDVCSCTQSYSSASHCGLSQLLSSLYEDFAWVHVAHTTPDSQTPLGIFPSTPSALTSDPYDSHCLFNPLVTCVIRGIWEFILGINIGINETPIPWEYIASL